MSRVTGCAADHDDDPSAGDRPGLPAPQEPRASAVVQLPFGQAHVFYPEATRSAARRRCCSRSIPSGWCAAAGERLFRSASTSTTGRTSASSFLSVALGEVFGTALAGRSKDRPELADDAAPARGADPGRCPAAAARTVLRRLFEPLGYAVDADADPARRPRSPSGATAATFTVTLSGDAAGSHELLDAPLRAAARARRRQALLGRRRRGREAAAPRRAAGSRAHPERELIARRYLKHRRALTPRGARAAADDEDDRPGRRRGRRTTREEEAVEEPHQPATSSGSARSSPRCAGAGAHASLDLGCGEGKLLRALLDEPAFERDRRRRRVAPRARRSPRERLQLDRLPRAPARARRRCCRAR